MQISDLRVLIAGCGSIGKRHAQVLRGLGVQALSACDPSAESREGMRTVLPGAPLYADFTEALAREKPDAAFILTPTGLHVPMAMQAIEAGCHVLIEKPLANRASLRHRAASIRWRGCFAGPADVKARVAQG